MLIAVIGDPHLSDQNGKFTLKADGDVLITESSITSSNQSETVDGIQTTGVRN